MIIPKITDFTYVNIAKMNCFFITGTSAGLGKALAELLLEDKNNFVYGFARNCNIKNVNYRHTTLDLNDLNAIKLFSFPKLKNATKIILINNAGVVGNINHIGKVDNNEIIKTYHVNLIAPTILINLFVKTYVKNTAEKLIINISSGAGRTPIDGWGVYCASKAGLDMFSQVLNEEFNIDKANFKILSLAPGIIDTKMQVEIRKSDKTAFSTINKFIKYKKEGNLTQPKQTAHQLLQFIKNPALAENILCSVRDLL